jgi:ClpX C4-type zinc finger
MPAIMGSGPDRYLTEAPHCSFCGTDEATHFITGRTAVICERCVVAAAVAGQPSAGTPCDLCGKALGTRVHWFTRRRVIAGTVAGQRLACTDCLALCREILAETTRGAV